jgi:hypothetical protein
MFIRSVLLSAAALGAGASAMLVDPVTESNTLDGFEVINPMELDEFNHATFSLPCTECPFRETTEEGQQDLTGTSPSTLVCGGHPFITCAFKAN